MKVAPLEKSLRNAGSEYTKVYFKLLLYTTLDRVLSIPWECVCRSKVQICAQLRSQCTYPCHPAIHWHSDQLLEQLHWAV